MKSIVRCFSYSKLRNRASVKCNLGSMAKCPDVFFAAPAIPRVRMDEVHSNFFVRMGRKIRGFLDACDASTSHHDARAVFLFGWLVRYGEPGSLGILEKLARKRKCNPLPCYCGLHRNIGICNSGGHIEEQKGRVRFEDQAETANALRL